MRSAKYLIFLFLASSMMVSCGGGDGGGGGAAAQEEEDGTTTGGSGADIVFDSELSAGERQALGNSTKAMGDFVIDGSPIRWFSEIFGGNSSSNVVNYFETRVNYALSAATPLESRVVRQPALMAQNLEVFATNPSFILWYNSLIIKPDNLIIQINNQAVDINSTRVGVMQFGDAFVTSDTALQAITLVHEARHSDCTGGALASDVERFADGQIPLNAPCGHLHDVCPPGHPLAGIVACDLHPWGAYVIDAIYSLAIAENCSSCTEAQKQAANINLLDVIQRPVFLEDLLNGEFGPPDMSSSNQVR